MTRHGSHAYGTNLPTSDIDIRGIFIAPKVYYLGCSKQVEQIEQKELDFCIFELRKFLKLASQCNPNALELIFTEPEDHLLTTPLSKILLDHRDLFLTRRVKYTFSGYAHAQMKRILTHRSWLLNPVEVMPKRRDFGLPERTVIPADQIMAAKALITKQVDGWTWHLLDDVTPDLRLAIQEEFTRRLLEVTSWSEPQASDEIWLSAGRSLGFDDNFLQIMDKERRYYSKLRNFQQYQEWKKSRNPARAEIEAKYGFDCKHAMHLVRLTRSCLETLQTGSLKVRRKDAEELLAIRNGAWTFDQLTSWFNAREKEIEEAEKVSTLPKSPDLKKIDDLCMALVEQSFMPGWKEG